MFQTIEEPEEEFTEEDLELDKPKLSDEMLCDEELKEELERNDELLESKELELFVGEDDPPTVTDTADVL